MVVAKKDRALPDDYIEDIKDRVRHRFPDAEFRVHQLKPLEYRIDVIADFEDSFDILDLTSERESDILVDTGIWIVTLPIRRSELAEIED